MRLIDADKLKEDLFIKFGNQLPNGLLDEVDNASTVIPDIEEFDKALHKWFEDIDEWEKKNGKIRPQGEWIDYDNTFYKCPECGYLLEKCCPQCQNKVILPKGGAK